MTLSIGKAIVFANNANAGKPRAEGGEEGDFAATVDALEPRKSAIRHTPVQSRANPDITIDARTDAADREALNVQPESVVDAPPATSLLDELVATGKGPPPEDDKPKPKQPGDNAVIQNRRSEHGGNLLITTDTRFTASAAALVSAAHGNDATDVPKDATISPAPVRLPNSPAMTLPPALALERHVDPTPAAATRISGDDLNARITAEMKPMAIVSRRAEPKGDAITVLAQQNMPAPAVQPSGSTASVLAGMIAGDTGWREAAAAAALRALPAQPALSSAHALKIQLHPAELGMVTANLRLSGDQLTVELRVKTHEAYQRLTTDSDTIVKSLRALGLDVDQITIQQPQTSNSTQARAEASASAGGLNARDQNQQSAGGGREQQSAGQSRSNANENSHGSTSAASTPVDQARGGLYI